MPNMEGNYKRACGRQLTLCAGTVIHTHTGPQKYQRSRDTLKLTKPSTANLVWSVLFH